MDCLIEGETVLLLAGLATHRGWLDPVAVVGIAAVADCAYDQVAFWLARGLQRWPTAMVIGVGFVYLRAPTTN